MGGTTAIRGGSPTTSSGASGADAARRAEEARRRAEAARKAAESARRAAEEARRAAESARRAQQKAQADAAKATSRAEAPGQTPKEAKASRKDAVEAQRAEKLSAQRAARAEEARRDAEEKSARSAQRAQGAMQEANTQATAQGLTPPYDEQRLKGVTSNTVRDTSTSSFEAASSNELRDKLLGNVSSPPESSALFTAERAAELDMSPELQSMRVADASAPEKEAWDRYDAHVKKGLDLKDVPGGLRQEFRDDYKATTERLQDEANKASVDRLRQELGATPEGKAALADLDARGVEVKVVDDASYPELQEGKTTDGHALPGNGDITLRRSAATSDVLLREARNSARTQELKLPTTAEDGARLSAAVAERIKANPRQPVEFTDNGVHLVAMKGAQPSVVEHGGSILDNALGGWSRPEAEKPFAALAQEEGRQPGSDTIINTSFYDRAFSGDNPVGQVIENGKVLGGESEPDRFYAAWTSSGLKFGQGDPPADSKVAFGGAVPLIINNTPYGDGNQYKPGTSSAAPLTGDPGAYASDLTQRNNEGFKDQDERGPNSGKVVVGYDRETGTTYVVAQENGEKPGKTLAEIRDALVKLGVDDAVSFDGSDSATLVRDDQVKVEPGAIKDRTIPFGLKLSLP
ncbi:phosphodiester glycosidase family protein [Myxococcus eversor]|uniref:phosphodiester glycosidase family protein n=1 Tax=Myxococcus eversor TaxID=2709661 RepID=UPI0013D083C7|nr:phosphodiester glycosidase family protein [Myxococcus eversor]